MSTKIILPTIAAAAILATPACASGQIGRWPDGGRYAYGAPVSYQEVRRMAYERGYREGLQQGERDARRGDRFEYRDHRDYERGDGGYHRSYGNRDRYRQIFRDGYREGYSDGYSRVSRYGRPGPRSGPYGRRGPYGGPGAYGRYGGAYYSPALENGIRDGYEKGQEDARRNRRFDPLRHSWYRAGDRHYESRYGSRDEYKDVYRRGFQEGYERGFRESRYRW